uniref:Uncharacterized protein n=1 Tax=Mycena chlorophos TaxID=658473 RepID=A0ABQ0M139_MYCCL|nr:predicted protein [Mycena chlorophos]
MPHALSLAEKAEEQTPALAVFDQAGCCVGLGAWDSRLRSEDRPATSVYRLPLPHPQPPPDPPRPHTSRTGTTTFDCVLAIDCQCRHRRPGRCAACPAVSGLRVLVPASYCIDRCMSSSAARMNGPCRARANGPGPGGRHGDSDVVRGQPDGFGGSRGAAGCCSAAAAFLAACGSRALAGDTIVVRRLGVGGRLAQGGSPGHFRRPTAGESMSSGALLDLVRPLLHFSLPFLHLSEAAVTAKLPQRPYRRLGTRFYGGYNTPHLGVPSPRCPTLPSDRPYTRIARERRCRLAFGSGATPAGGGCADYRRRRGLRIAATGPCRAFSHVVSLPPPWRASERCGDRGRDGLDEERESHHGRCMRAVYGCQWYRRDVDLGAGASDLSCSILRVTDVSLPRIGFPSKRRDADGDRFRRRRDRDSSALLGGPRRASAQRDTTVSAHSRRTLTREKTSRDARRLRLDNSRPCFGVPTRDSAHSLAHSPTS